MTSRDVAKAAKLRGLTLQSAAVAPIVRTLRDEDYPAEALGTILDAIKEHLDANPAASRLVSEETVTSVVAELSKNDVDLDAARVQLLNATDMPRLTYDPARRLFAVEEVWSYKKEKKWLTTDV
mgnify:CR=1 FL=1